jgi:cell division protein FtsL
MAPPPAGTAVVTRRHAAVASHTSPRRDGRGAEAPSTRRAPLRVVPTRSRRGIRGGRTAASRGRLLTIISVGMVVAALLAVVVGQALLANGQVKLAALQQELTMEQSKHRQAELSDAKLETPTRIVAYATSQLHMVATGASRIELPYVSLSVPLPTPKVTPAPAPPPPTTSSAGAGAPAGDGTTGNSGTGATSATTTPTSTP